MGMVSSEGKGSNVNPGVAPSPSGSSYPDAGASVRKKTTRANKGTPMDITQLILDDPHEQRRLFAILEQIEPADSKALGAVWARLSALLQVYGESAARPL